MRRLLAAVGVAGIMALSTPVLAQDYDAVIEEPAADAVPAPRRQFRYVPQVYGWGAQVEDVAPARPTDCGLFHYWNGSRCADARYEPPTLD